jgi:hypothetical protein
MCAFTILTEIIRLLVRVVDIFVIFHLFLKVRANGTANVGGVGAGVKCAKKVGCHLVVTSLNSRIVSE